MGSLNHRLENDDIARLGQAVQLNERSGQYTRRWEHINALMQTCAPFVWIMRDLASGKWAEIYRSNTGPLIRFYNDSVDFILGKPRTVSVQIWDDVVVSAIDAGKFEPTRQIVGNIGTQILSNYTTEVDTPNAITSQTKPKLRSDLLGMSDTEIVTMWINRQRGVDDMVHTLALLAQVHAIFMPE